MVSMKTFRDEQGAGDETCWFYEEATGLLTNKVYADGKGTAYTYTSDGQLASRIWARGVTTTYAYTNGSSLVAIDYSDSTPDVAFQYDRLGRQKVAQTFLSAHHFAYDGLDLVSETVIDPQTGVSNVLTRSIDALGRPAGIALSSSPYDVSYAYDAYGRFIAVTAQVHILTHGYTYSYLAGSDLVATMANSHGHTATRTYDPVLPHITRVHNGFTGGRTISQYDYTYDALGRRTAIASSGEAFTFSNANDLAAFNLYGYNTRSEVTSAARYWGTDTGDTSDAVDGQQYAYAFDPIGNRITAAEGDTSRTAGYTANELNQYSQRTVPGVKERAGTALAEATVTVNELPTDRYGPWWRHAFAVDNTSSTSYTQAVVTAVYNPPGTNDPDVVTSQTGRVFVAQTPETFTYDDDGNLTRDGRFNYAWDAENRLFSVTTRDDLPADLPRVRVTHQYDHRSRRIATARETWSGTAWQPAGTNRYLYDGWNVVAETRSASPANTNLYVWGLDLSGSLQGAGGIGGLLTVRKRLEDGTGLVRNCDFLFDANGNVVQETFRTDGAINAHYEYDPFGNAVIALRVDATDNPFRFSTKWFDNDTGLGYWGYRWYGPGMGRWMSRDPIGDIGGLALYAYVNNYSIQQVDALGLVSCLTAVKHIINNMDNSPSTKERYQLMTKKGCNIEVKCAKCCPKGLGGSRTSAEGDPKSSIIEICPRFLKSQEYYSKIFLHEFSHAFDYCVNTDDIYWAWKCSVNIRHSICTELRAYFNDPPKDWYPGKKEDVIKKACDSVKLPCISWNDPDGEKARKRCLDLAPEIYDVCTQLDPTDPLPPIPPDWNIPIGLFP